MDLTEVKQKLSPGLEAALDQTLSYREITRLCQRSVVELCIQREGNQYRAARKLGLTDRSIGDIANGKPIKSRGRPRLSDKQSPEQE